MSTVTRAAENRYTVPMMGFNNYGWSMMGGGGGTLGAIVWLVVLVDLILVGVWLWQQIRK